jgi:hypothetical protein
LPQREIIIPIQTGRKCYLEMRYDKNITIEEIEEMVAKIRDNDTCALLLVKKKMHDDWVDVAKIYSQESPDLQMSYFDYWTRLIRESSLTTSFKEYLLIEPFNSLFEGYCRHYWSSRVRHEPTGELCDKLLFDNGTDLVEAVYFRALLLNEQLEHVYRVQGCSREYTAGLFYLINLRKFLFVDNEYGSNPLMSLKGKELFYSASIKVGECVGFTREVWETYNMAGDVKHLFVKD